MAIMSRALTSSVEREHLSTSYTVLLKVEKRQVDLFLSIFRVAFTKCTRENVKAGRSISAR